MPYLLDTNICIYIIKKRPLNVLKRFQSFRLGDLAISMITVAELEFGARKSSRIEENLLALSNFLLPLDLVCFDRLASVAYGVIRTELETNGTPIGPLDTLIAAQAKSLDYTLVTNNEREFNRVNGLRVENWT